MDKKRLTLIAAICGGATALGALLPWISVNTVSGGTYMTVSGVDFAKGIFVLILGLAGGAAALLVHLGKAGQLVKLDERQHLYIALGCLGLALILTLTQFLSSHYQTVTVMGQSMGGASRGFGLWLCLLATIGGSVAAFLAVKPPGAPKTPATGA